MLKGYLPGNIKKNLDFKSLKISKNSFIDRRLKNYFADLLYEIKLKSSQKSAFIYILFEHKCWEDWFVCLQLLKYIHSPELRNKLWDIFKLFLELSDKNKIVEYLEVLVNYLANSPGELTDEELREPVTRIIKEGGAIMQTIAEKWMEEGKEEKAKETAKMMLNDGLATETIAKYTGLPTQEIEKLMKVSN
jgi:predicted transposase YdaD